MQNFFGMSDANEPNPLERALSQAAENAANRPDFYRLLLESQVFVVGDAGETEDGDRRVQTGENVSIQQWQQPDGRVVIPFFTSLAAVEQAIDGPVSCLAIPARALFQSTRGATLVLNPNNEYGKQFLPDEIDAIISSGVPRPPTPRVEELDAQALFSEPKNYPTRMVDALTAFFAKRSDVKAAYLAQLTYESTTAPQSHLALGIDAAGDFERLCGDIATVVVDTAPRDERVIIYPVFSGGGDLADYLIDCVKPFYENSWGARLNNPFGAGHA